MNIDLAAFLREFGLSVVIVLFVGWFLLSVLRSFLPQIANAISKRIEAGTRLVDVTTTTVANLPAVITQSGKETRDAIAAGGRETRDAIASYEKAVIASETRILDAFSKTLVAIKDEIFDEKQAKIERGLGRLSRASPDSDPPSPLPKS